MIIVPLPNHCFKNIVFYKDVIKFNKVVKVALVVMGTLALASAYTFSATLLPVAIGAVLFLAALVAARTLVFHNKKYDERMRNLEAATKGEDPAKAYFSLANLLENPNVTPELTNEERILKQYKYLIKASENSPIALRGNIHLKSGHLIENHGVLITRLTDSSRNLSHAAANYLFATIPSANRETRVAAYQALISLYRRRGLEFVSEVEKQEKIALYTHLLTKLQTSTDD